MSHQHSFIHSDHFYSVSSSPLLFRSAPDRARILCRSFTPKRHRQLQVKNLPKVPTWRLGGFEPMTLWLKGIDSTKCAATSHKAWKTSMRIVTCDSCYNDDVLLMSYKFMLICVAGLWLSSWHRRRNHWRKRKSSPYSLRLS